jgi:hypothetical protein
MHIWNNNCCYVTDVKSNYFHFLQSLFVKGVILCTIYYFGQNIGNKFNRFTAVKCQDEQ